MSRIQSPRYSRIQERLPDSRVDALYQPLRSTILKHQYSQSRILRNNDYSHIDPGNSKLQLSRVSKKMRSLSPQQTLNLKNNIYVPITKRIIATRNYEKIQGKQFQAIDCEQKYFDPIPEKILKSNKNIKFGSVDKIVYQFQDSQGLKYQNINNFSSNRLNQKNFNNFNKIRIQNRFSSPQFKVSNPLSTVNNIYTTRQESNSYPLNLQPQNRKINQNNYFSRSQLQQNNAGNSFKNNQFNSFLRQFPSEKIISPLMSRTSFQAGVNNNNVNVNKNYDFNKSNVSSQSLYKQKKKQAFKYNLFSILDEPGNTKCKSGCCGQNQIIAKNPTIYQWAQ